MNRKRKRSVYECGDNECWEPSSKKRKEITHNIHVLKVQLLNKSTNTIAVIGNKKDGVRVIWCLYNCKPYIYYFSSRNKNPNDDEFVQEFYDKNGSILKSNQIMIDCMETVYGRPLHGFQKNKTKYLKIFLKSEYDRQRMHRVKKKLTNVVETGISYFERFQSDSGILVGRWIKVKTGDTNKECLNQFVKTSGYREDTVLVTTDYNLFIHNPIYYIGSSHDYSTMNKCSYTMGAFRTITYTSPSKSVYPMATDKVNEYNSYRKCSSSVTSSILAIIIRISRIYYDSSGNMKNVERTFIMSRFLIYESPIDMDNVKVQTFLDTNHIKNEINVIKKTINILGMCDYITGFKISDSLSRNSIQFLIHRLIQLGESEILIGTYPSKSIRSFLSRSRNEKKVGKNWIPIDKSRDLFQFSTVVDLFDYANGYYSKKSMNEFPKNSSFDVLIKDDGDVNCLDLSTKCDFMKNDKVIDDFMSKNILPGKKIVHIIQTEIGESKKTIQFFYKNHIMSKTTQRASEWIVDTNLVWTTGQTTIFRNTFLRLISKMRLESSNCGLDCYYVIHPSLNYFKYHPSSIDSFIDPNDPVRGGRVIDPSEYGFVSSSVFTLDFSNNYPGIIVDAKLDPTNVLFINEHKENVKNSLGINTLVDSEHEVLCTKIGNVNVGFVQNRKSNVLPLVRLFQRLSNKRTKIETKLSSNDIDCESRITLIEKKNAVKKVMVSITGCLSISNFDYLFRFNVVGETMRWIARRRFDLAVELTLSHQVYMTNDNSFSIKKSKKEDESMKDDDDGKGVYNFDVIMGHTDGFDVLIEQNGYGVDCEEQLLRSIGDELGVKLTLLIKKYDYGMVRVTNYFRKRVILKYPQYTMNSIQLKIERLAKKAIYINCNNKIMLKYNNEIEYKGSYNKDLQNCLVQKRVYESVIRRIFDDDEIVSGRAYTNIFSNRISDIVHKKNWLNYVVKFAKFTTNRSFSRFSGRDAIVRMFGKLCSSCNIDIPSINQYVGYVWVVEIKTKKKFAMSVKQFDPILHEIDFGKYVEEFEHAIGFLTDL